MDIFRVVIGFLLSILFYRAVILFFAFDSNNQEVWEFDGLIGLYQYLNVKLLKLMDVNKTVLRLVTTIT